MWMDGWMLTTSDNKGSQKLLLNGLATNIIVQYQIKKRLEIEQKSISTFQGLFGLRSIFAIECNEGS